MAQRGQTQHDKKRQLAQNLSKVVSGTREDCIDRITVCAFEEVWQSKQRLVPLKPNLYAARGNYSGGTSVFVSVRD